MQPVEGDTSSFLTSFANYTLDPNSRPSLACAAVCNALKASTNEVSSCNTFVLKDGLCYLGYLEPLWIVENTGVGIGTDIIYTDVFN